MQSKFLRSEGWYHIKDILITYYIRTKSPPYAAEVKKTLFFCFSAFKEECVKVFLSLKDTSFFVVRGKEIKKNPPHAPFSCFLHLKVIRGRKPDRGWLDGHAWSKA